MKKQQKGFERDIRLKFIITAIVPVLLLLFLFTCFMWTSSRIMVKRKTREAGERIAEKVQEMDTGYRADCLSMAENPDALLFIKTGTGREKVFEKYYQSVAGREVRFQMVLVDMEKNIVLRTSTRDGYELDYSFMSLEKLAKQKDQREIRIFSRVQADDGLAYYYGYGAVIYEKGEAAGYVLYYVSNRQLNGLLEESGAEEVILTNQFDAVIATTAETARNPLNKFAYEAENGNLTVNGGQYYMSSTELPDAGLKVHALGSRIYEKYLFQIIPPFVGIVVIFLLAVMYYLSKDMSRRVTEPIHKLMEAVEKTGRGQFDVNVELNTGDEFELLAGEYNRMVRKVDQLIETNQKMAELQREAEFKMIRNQFNPHFIFNVLETLRYMVFVDQKGTEKNILALSKFLRYNIYNQDKFVPLKEDMEHMEDFFILHKARFQERMTYEISIEPGAESVFVPKFFIQPFAENSIKYGFRSRDRFHISVTAGLKGDRLAVSVKDDGGGMTAEKYGEVCSHLQSEQYPDDHIGLYNSHKILKMIYGEEYGLCLHNEEGVGLEVCVEIPARES